MFQAGFLARDMPPRWETSCLADYEDLIHRGPPTPRTPHNAEELSHSLIHDFFSRYDFTAKRRAPPPPPVPKTKPRPPPLVLISTSTDGRTTPTQADVPVEITRSASARPGSENLAVEENSDELDQVYLTTGLSWASSTVSIATTRAARSVSAPCTPCSGGLSTTPLTTLPKSCFSDCSESSADDASQRADDDEIEAEGSHAAQSSSGSSEASPPSYDTHQKQWAEDVS